LTNILITGGTGSLGSALARKWVGEGHRVTILSRDPMKQQQLASELPEAIFILADIRNYHEVKRACAGQDILIHAAALKQVSTGEYHPVEFSQVNVQGTITVANAWFDTHKTDEGKAVLVSTDKAVSALNGYGSDKKRAESVFRKFDYSVLRYGNVVESNGSFVHAWKRAISEAKPITLRTPEPTRFFLTLPQALALIEDTLKRIDRMGNGIFVPHDLKAFSVWDVAKALQVKYITQPLLPYEKRHETLVAEGEGVEQVSDLLSRIRPYWPDNDDFSFLAQFRSNTAPRMSGKEVLEVLGWQKESVKRPDTGNLIGR
jgi:UDP-N-acetylglucosamine 4,6-dehydratase/5-epimerase